MTGTTPDDATRAEEEKEAHAEHVAGEAANAEQAADAPTEAGDGVSEHYHEMTEKGAHIQGEGETP
jgi:hypothetical protein